MTRPANKPPSPAPHAKRCETTTDAKFELLAATTVFIEAGTLVICNLPHPFLAQRCFEMSFEIVDQKNYRFPFAQIEQIAGKTENHVVGLKSPFLF